MANILKFKKKENPLTTPTSGDGGGVITMSDFENHLLMGSEIAKQFKESEIKTGDTIPYIETDEFKDINEYLRYLIDNKDDVAATYGSAYMQGLLWNYIFSKKEFTVRNIKPFKQFLVRLIYAYNEALFFSDFNIFVNSTSFSGELSIFDITKRAFVYPELLDDGFNPDLFSEGEIEAFLDDSSIIALIFSHGMYRENHASLRDEISDFDRTSSYWFFERTTKGLSLAVSESKVTFYPQYRIRRFLV